MATQFVIANVCLTLLPPASRLRSLSIVPVLNMAVRVLSREIHAVSTD